MKPVRACYCLKRCMFSRICYKQNSLHEYTFQFFCYVYLNLSTQKDINVLFSLGTPEQQGSVGSDLADYREKKKGKGTRGGTGESGR